MLCFVKGVTVERIKAGDGSTFPKAGGIDFVTYWMHRLITTM